ncbi:MAG: hypothetical protein N2505_05420 [Endomicrobia bacterium]|nr:hypothetical protein [Endomicrobiia bacterium]
MKKPYFCKSTAFYKYVIPQQIASKTVAELKKKLYIKKLQFFKIGGTAFYLSPVFFGPGKTDIFAQLHMDIEIEDPKAIKESVWNNFIEVVYNKNFYLVYTGGSGIHIYSKKAVYFSGTEDIFNQKSITERVFEYFRLEPHSLANIIGGKYDYRVAVGRIPTIRFGWREDKGNFAVPLVRELGLASFVIFNFLIQEGATDKKEKLLQNIFEKDQNFLMLIDKYLLPCK